MAMSSVWVSQKKVISLMNAEPGFPKMECFLTPLLITSLTDGWLPFPYLLKKEKSLGRKNKNSRLMETSKTQRQQTKQRKQPKQLSKSSRPYWKVNAFR